MWSSRRYGAIMLVLVGCLGLTVAAQSDLRGANDEITGSLGAPARPAAAGRGTTLALSDDERGRIYEGVMKLPHAPVAEVPAPEIADALPSGVELQELPATIIRDIPLVQGHKFVKLDDRILVVDPTDRLVVAMIPRYKLLQ